MPDRHIVRDLRQRDERHEKAEHGEQCRRHAPMAEPQERPAECGERDHLRGPDEEVKVDQRLVPVLMVRPRIEQWERQTPEQPRHHRPEHSARKERNTSPILQQHKDNNDRNEPGEKILRAHVLSHIDIGGNHDQKIDARRRRIADPLIGPLHT